jgi:hypothetical protein
MRSLLHATLGSAGELDLRTRAPDYVAGGRELYANIGGFVFCFGPVLLQVNFPVRDVAAISWG